METAIRKKMIETEVFKALFTHASEGILIVQNGKISRVNNSALKLFGYGETDLIGKEIEILIPDRFKQKHVEKRDHYSSHPQARPMAKGAELYGQKKTGEEFPVEISLSPFEQAGERFVLAFIIDITNRKKAEEKLKHYSEELEREVKDRTLVLEEAIHQLELTKEELKEALQKEKELNDLKSRFVSMASHEFRTPLATILSSVSLVNKYTEPEHADKKIKHIVRIKTAVNNMTDILNDFLSLSKLEEGKISYDPENFDIRELSTTVVQEMQALTRGEQKIEFTYEGGNKMYSDKKIIRNILLNLISNAIKFSYDNGKINVILKCGEKLSITVSDHGIGIGPDDKKHLFERFFRGKNATNIQGTGLGLNIVAKYIELLGGEINFESELNKGTTFHITIPIE